MPTPTTMIIRAQQMIGEKIVGGTLSAGEQTAYLSVLNGMIESWSLDRLTIPALIQESFALVAGTGSYTIGTAGTFVSATGRPIKIVKAFVRDSASFDTDLLIIERDAYDSIKLKTATGNTYPANLFYDPTQSATLGTIYVNPLPQAGLTLYIDSWKVLQTFAAVSDVLTLPPGYQRAIESNLAIELAAGLVPVSNEVLKIAKESKAAIMKNNLPVGMLQMDSGVVRRRTSNIISGP